MKAKIVLEDGKTYYGDYFGQQEAAEGQVVFNTSMNGYQEVITDPSLRDQIVVMTYPEIGNYGVMEEENGKSPKIRALIVKDLCLHPSNSQSIGSLEDYLKKHGVIGLSGVDTRSLTRYIRSKGPITGRILPTTAGKLSDQGVSLCQ